MLYFHYLNYIRDCNGLSSDLRRKIKDQSYVSVKDFADIGDVYSSSLHEDPHALIAYTLENQNIPVSKMFRMSFKNWVKAEIAVHL